MKKLIKYRYEAEKAYAGNPSGIDNTAATYGGLMWFRKNMAGGQDLVEHLSIEEPVEIVIGSTGKVANTKAMVEGVDDRKRKNPQKYNTVFKRAEELAYEGRAALEFYNLKKVGELMNENHRLLQEIEVSSIELDQLVDIARKHGCFWRETDGWRRRRMHGCIDSGKRVAEQSCRRH